MGERIIQENTLTKLANAIRMAEGTDDPIKIGDMPKRITNLRTNLLNKQPIAKATGNFIQLNDVSEIPQYVTINVSNSANKNIIITGSNLLDLNFDIQTKNHLTCSQDINGCVKLSGHTDEDIFFDLGPLFLLKPETYTFGLNDSNYVFIIKTYNEKNELISEYETSHSLTFTTTENVYCKCYLKVFKSSNIILTYLNLMLNLGSSLLDFEPSYRQKYNVNISNTILIKTFPYCNIFALSDKANIEFDYHQSAGIVFMAKGGHK